MNKSAMNEAWKSRAMRAVHALANQTPGSILVVALFAFTLTWLGYTAANIVMKRSFFGHLERWRPFTYEEHVRCFALGGDSAGGAPLEQKDLDSFPVFVTEGSFAERPVKKQELKDARCVLSNAVRPSKEQYQNAFTYKDGGTASALQLWCIFACLSAWSNGRDDMGDLTSKCEQAKALIVKSAGPHLWLVHSREVHDQLEVIRKSHAPDKMLKCDDNVWSVDSGIVKELCSDDGKNSRAWRKLQEDLSSVSFGEMGREAAGIFSVVLFSNDNMSNADVDNKAEATVLEVSHNGVGNVFAMTYLLKLPAESGPAERYDLRRHAVVPVMEQKGSWLTGIRPTSAPLNEDMIVEKLFRDEMVLSISAGSSVAREEVMDQKMKGYCREALTNRLSRESSGRGSRESLESLVVWPRRFNGGSWWGCIQFATIWLLCFGLLQAVGLWAITRRGERERVGTGNGARASADDLFAVAIRPSGIEEARSSFQNATASLYYVNWAIPGVGFLGTVVGISDAMVQMNGAVTGSVEGRQNVIQSMSVSLGIAFDTTFVALAASIVVMLALTWVNQRAEALLLRAGEFVRRTAAGTE